MRLIDADALRKNAQHAKDISKWYGELLVVGLGHILNAPTIESPRDWTPCAETTNEPTTGEMIDVLRENGDVYFGETEITCDQIADRLESQERDIETLRAFHERYAEQTSKKYVEEICALTARAESAERERDELVDLIPHTCNTCYFQSKNLLNEEPCVSCRIYSKWTWRGQPQDGGRNERG